MKAVFLERHNRFVASVRFRGEVQKVYVPNTGRCRELLFHGNTVHLEHGTPGSKYPFYIGEAQKNDYFVSIDAKLPNQLIEEALRDGLFGLNAEIEREVRLPSGSRLDFRVGNCYIEVKGVTLDKGGRALFPDAPTERGIKHLRELTRLAQEGYRAIILFVVLTRSTAFSANPERPEYALALRQASEQGVEVRALRFEKNKTYRLAEDLQWIEGEHHETCENCI